MATTVKQIEQGTPVTLLSTELNSLANNTNVVSSVGGTSGCFNNSQNVANFDGYVRGKLELVLGAPSGTVSQSSSLNVYFLRTVDGVNFEDGGASVTPAGSPDAVMPLNATSLAQRVIQECLVPVGLFKVLVRNSATGVTLAASGNTLKLLLSSEMEVG